MPIYDQPGTLGALNSASVATALNPATDFILVSQNSANKNVNPNQRIVKVAAAIPVSLFAATAPVTNANSTTAATLFGAGSGSRAIPVAAFMPGSTFATTLRGSASTGATPGTKTFLVKLGATTIATAVATVAASQANVGIEVQATFTVATAGAIGTVNVAGGVTVEAATRAFVAISASAVSVDLSADRILDVTIQESVANASNAVTINTATLSRQR